MALTRKEPEEVYKSLVADLAYSAVPTAIMGVSIVVVAAFVHNLTGSWHVLVPMLLGGVATTAKLLLVVLHRRFNRSDYRGMGATVRFERLHSLATAGMALSVAAIATLAFLLPNETVDVVATALVFGYGAGVVCRLSVRPYLAGAALSVATIPPTGALFALGDHTHTLVGVMFVIFGAGALETISHVYSNSRRHIESQLRMAELARRDHLTGLPNRLALEEAFGDGRFRTGGGLVAVHAFDLDGFKAMNDRHGHPAGDQLLRILANRLRTVLSDRDFAARIGGDEFVVVQSGIASSEDADAFADSVHRLLTTGYPVGPTTFRVGLSLGYAMASAGTADLQALLVEADAASYAAKKRGGGYQATG